jgi:penicillin-binding protein 1A
VAFLVSSVLEGAVERGTAKRARIPGHTVAAKTGTSQDAADLWLMGYTPRLAAGLWVGYDQPRSLGSQESAGRLVAPMWAGFMRRVLYDLPPESVTIPEGVFSATVNYLTGLPTDPDDPQAITEFFIRGDVRGPATASPPASPPEPAPVPLAPAVQPILPEPAGASQR